jgi:hypothetical protein
MAKSWQYGRWRPVALQVVMWLIFASSLGLAAYIDHRRTGTFDITPGEPVTFGRLVVRVPKGWESQEEAGSPHTLVMEDFDNPDRKRWTIQVTEEQQPPGRRRGAAHYLETVLALPSQLSVHTEPYRMLGDNEGALIVWRGLRDYIPLANDDVEGFPASGVYACAVLPDGLTVTVRVTGPGAYGPSARIALRKAADNIRVADTMAATKPAS